MRGWLRLLLGCIGAVVLATARPALPPTAPDAMPPHPDVLAAYRQRGEPLPAFLTASPPPGVLAPDAPNPAAPSATGTFRTLAILVQFSDNAAQADATYFDTLLFGSGDGTLPHFYAENSYGQLDIVGVTLPSAIGWRTMPQTYAYYVHGDAGLTYTYPQNAQGLARDAALAANAAVDFSRYDNDGNGVLDTVFIIHAGPGAEFTGDSAHHIWSHSWAVPCCLYLDGVRVASYTMEPECWYCAAAASLPAKTDMTVGVYAHELGHVLGLPDLYDRDDSSYGAGKWSLMANGSWNGYLGDSPAHLDAWSKVQLGWVTPVTVTHDTLGASLPAVETSPTVYRLWTEGAAGDEYFLLENRQKVGYDAALPGAGLLIWHVDDGLAFGTGNDAECKQHSNWLCGSAHYGVALEQANGLLQLEHRFSSGSSGHPWPGSGNRREFTFTTTPNSSSYAGSGDTLIRVRNIANSGSVMTADLHVGVAGPAATLGLAAGWNLIALPVVPDDFSPGSVFAPLAGRYDAAYTYENCGAGAAWQVYDPNGAPGDNTLTQLQMGRGIWLHTLEAASLPLYGAPLSAPISITVCAGWNLVGYPVARASDDALAPYAAAYERLLSYDAGGAANPWETHHADLPPYANTLAAFDPARGYWLLVNQDVTIVVEP